MTERNVASLMILLVLAAGVLTWAIVGSKAPDRRTAGFARVLALCNHA
jgi:hypothetical protein